MSVNQPQRIASRNENILLFKKKKRIIFRSLSFATHKPVKNKWWYIGHRLHFYNLSTYDISLKVETIVRPQQSPIISQELDSYRN